VTSIAVFGTASATSPAAVGGGSASVIPPYIVSPLDGLSARAGTQVTVASVPVDTVTPDVVPAAAAADVAVVVVYVPSSEGVDRASLSLDPGMDALIEAVAAANPNTVVVLHVPGAVLMPWLSQVAAVLVGWFPGQENGNALAAILFGDEDPGGRLPVTFPAAAGDLPAPDPGASVVYTEALGIGYRGLDARGVDPLFPFGHGLSYTTFGYSALAMDAGSAPGAVDVSFTLQNQGSRPGTEVPQLYLAYPPSAGEPPKVLRGFSRLDLDAGAESPVTLTLTARDFSVHDPVAHARKVVSGVYTVGIGHSSRDVRLVGTIQVAGVGP
jgi:beta-glucosidase